MNIMLIDDDADSLTALAAFLDTLGHTTRACTDPHQALAALEEIKFGLVITDLRMPEMDGIEILQKLQTGRDADAPHVIILTGHADTDSAIQAMRMGAYDYLRKPVDTAELEIVVERCAAHRAILARNLQLTEQFDDTVNRATRDVRNQLTRARALLRRTHGLERIVAVSPAMRALVEKAALYHRHPDIPVMLQGETGVGKEVLARLIHHGESVEDAPFIAINCTAVAANLFESELFGYEAGAYTGGHPDGARGKLELAGSGTLLLDEIGDMPLELQPKLLRVLQERCFYRVGGLKRLEFKARLICASNRDLQAMVRDGRLRPDLYYRLKVGHMILPPLRERPEDIRPLADFFLQRAARKCRRQFRQFDQSAIDLLTLHPWPGNIRQLENSIERATLESDAEVMTAQHLRFLEDAPVHMPAAGPATYMDVDPQRLPEVFMGLQELERRVVEAAFEKHQGNVTATARYLGISRNSLYCRLRRYFGK